MLCESITGVSELFQGSLQSTLACNSCKATRSTLDPYKDLQVEIGEIDKSLASCIKDYLKESLMLKTTLVMIVLLLVVQRNLVST
jgi:ubiquitin C-terminal hydrolase